MTPTMTTPQQVLSDEQTLDNLIRLAGRKDVIHSQFQGRPMSNETYDAFVRLRDVEIPYLKRTILAKLQAAPQAANLHDPAVQKRLAAQWGYTQAAPQAPFSVSELASLIRYHKSFGASQLAEKVLEWVSEKQAAPQAQAEPTVAASLSALLTERLQGLSALSRAQLGQEIMRLFAQQPAQGVGEVVAWCTPDGERCVTARTYEGARRDGGAIWSSMAPFTVPGYASPAPSPEAVPEHAGIALNFNLTKDKLPDLIEYSSSYAGQWRSDWCVVIGKSGAIDTAKLTVSGSVKKMLDSGVDVPRNRGYIDFQEKFSGFHDGTCVAWAYAKDIRAVIAALTTQQAQSKGGANG